MVDNATHGPSAAGRDRRRDAASTLRCKPDATTMHRMSRARQSQLLRGVLDVCLLAVIDQSPAYGYEMTRRLRGRGLDVVGEGSIYPALGRLQRDGLVAEEREAGNGGPPRKVYRLTDAGRAALLEWTEEWLSVSGSIDRVLRTEDRRMR